MLSTISAMTKILPGFQDLVEDSQATFRTLLDAFALPGKVNQIKAKLQPPTGLNLACAAACLTLLDLETQVWLQPGFQPLVKAWLLFHTGCRFTDSPCYADFALIRDAVSMPELSTFNSGTVEKPEASTTLLIQGTDLQGNQAVSLTGPGILGDRVLALPNLPDFFWQEWRANLHGYPLGIDIFFFADNLVLGLPRTTKIERLYEVN